MHSGCTFQSWMHSFQIRMHPARTLLNWTNTMRLSRARNSKCVSLPGELKSVALRVRTRDTVAPRRVTMEIHWVDFIKTHTPHLDTTGDKCKAPKLKYKCFIFSHPPESGSPGGRHLLPTGSDAPHTGSHPLPTGSHPPPTGSRPPHTGSHLSPAGSHRPPPPGGDSGKHTFLIVSHNLAVLWKNETSPRRTLQFDTPMTSRMATASFDPLVTPGTADFLFEWTRTRMRFSWVKAAGLCRDLRAQLPSFTDREEMQEFIALFKLSQDPPPVLAVYIGLLMDHGKLVRREGANFLEKRKSEQIVFLSLTK